MQPGVIRMHTSAVYTIRVVGAQDDSWSGRLADLIVSTSRDGLQMPVTTLPGSLIGQAALFGVLNSLCDMLFPMLSVECTVCE